MAKRSVAEIESRVVGMYQKHPFPAIQDKTKKTENEMDMRLLFLGIGPENYVGKNVLDAGCGTGEYTCWYAAHGANVTAIDMSEPSLQVARDWAQKEGLHNISFQSESVLSLPFPDESFDYVYSMGVLMVTPDPLGGFRELCRVLRSGGIVMISLYNKFGRFRHRIKQIVVNFIAGEDIDRRVRLAKRLFPRTCRSLKESRPDDSDVIIYDAFGIPHESLHSIGEVLRWFDRNGIDYLGAFGPVTLRDNLLALRLMNSSEFSGFKRFFEGFRLARLTINVLSLILGGFGRDTQQQDIKLRRPSWASRAFVQFCWFLLGFRFSIFALSGRKIMKSKPTKA